MDFLLVIFLHIFLIVHCRLHVFIYSKLIFILSRYCPYHNIHHFILFSSTFFLGIVTTSTPSVTLADTPVMSISLPSVHLLSKAYSPAFSSPRTLRSPLTCNTLPLCSSCTLMSVGFTPGTSSTISYMLSSSDTLQSCFL